MKPIFLFACCLGAWAAAAPLAPCAQAQVQTEASPAPIRQTEAVPAARLFLVVNADEAEFSADALVPRLTAELHTEVVPLQPGTSPNEVGVITITWRPTRAELAVAFHDRARGVVSRVIAAPAAVQDALRAAVWLAGNVVRDDVADLLGAVPAVQPSPPPQPISATPTPPPPVPREAPPASVAGYSAVTLSLVHPLATNANQPDIRTRFNVNLLMGRVGQLDGLQLGGLGVVGGNVSGGQASLAANFAGGSTVGFQLATLLNVTKQDLAGVQGSFGMNVVGAELQGLQAALLGNWVAGDVRGGQAAFVVNGTQGHLHGVQVALGVNHAAGQVVGAQVAAINVAGDVRGLQVGLLNVAKQVGGLQLGLVNIADDIKGLPIGIVSVSKSGGVHPMLWFSVELAFNLAIKFATRYTYSAVVVSAGRDRGTNQIGPGYLLGAHIPMGPLYFETDVGATYLFGGEACCVSSDVGLADDRLLARWRALIGVQVARRLGVFVGAGSTVAVRFKQGLEKETTGELRPDVFAGVSL